MFDSPVMPPNALEMGLCYDQYSSHELSNTMPLYYMSSLDGMWDDSFEPDVRQPLYPSSNRFETLADHALDICSGQEQVPSSAPRTRSHHPRQRNSRGTKEGKRRRDARRKKAKYDAQKLDEQLTRQLDELFNTVTTYHHAPHSPPASPVTTLDLALKTPSRVQHTVVSPAQLSYSGRIDLTEPICYVPDEHFRQMSSPDPEPLEYRSDHMSFSDAYAPELDMRDIWWRQLCGMHAQQPLEIAGSLPSWCPALPAFNRNNLWLSGQPVFHDLSSLPEPPHAPVSEPKSQDTRIWRPHFEKRQSRFFPSKTGSHLKVKLPSHTPKPSNQNSWTKDNLRALVSTNSNLVDLTSPIERVASTAGAESKDDTVQDSSAANLWNILDSEDRSEPMKEDCPQLLGCKHDDQAPPYAPSFVSDAESPQTCLELDSTEVPYAHANSLLGIANEIANLPYTVGREPMIDSAVYLPQQTEVGPPMFGMNELTVDHDIEHCYSGPKPTASSGSTAATPDVLASGRPHTYAIGYGLSEAHLADADGIPHGANDTPLESSDAHYYSEKELFALPSPPALSSEGSPIDVGAFLKLGHGRVCWCQDCEDVPELVSTDSLNGDEDDWTVCTPNSEDDVLAVDVASPTTQRVQDREDGSIVEAGKPLAEVNFFPYLLDPCYSQGEAVGSPEARYRRRGDSEEDWIFDCEV